MAENKPAFAVSQCQYVLLHFGIVTYEYQQSVDVISIVVHSRYIVLQ